jgi:hypothetical protein
VGEIELEGEFPFLNTENRLAKLAGLQENRRGRAGEIAGEQEAKNGACNGEAVLITQLHESRGS